MLPATKLKWCWQIWRSFGLRILKKDVCVSGEFFSRELASWLDSVGILIELATSQQEVELDFELEWGDDKFTELQVKHVFFYPGPKVIM